MIFLNYREGDEHWAAVTLDRELSAKLGDDAVFVDWRSIPHGTPFERAILDAVRSAAVLLVVIGERWLQADANGIRKIDLSDDWVRREIVAALTTDTAIVPILVGNVTALRAADLPPIIRRLAKCQAVRLRHRDSPRDIAYIVDVVCDLLPNWPPTT